MPKRCDSSTPPTRTEPPRAIPTRVVGRPSRSHGRHEAVAVRAEVSTPSVRRTKSFRGGAGIAPPPADRFGRDRHSS